jgi:hypothetical protein
MLTLMAFSAQAQKNRCGTFEPDMTTTEFLMLSDCGYLTNNPNPIHDPSFYYTIPVVFHVIQDNSGDGYLSPETINDQIYILNEDFRAIHGSPGAPGANARIIFQLATTDPSGNPTTGITYSTNNTWFQDNGSYWNSLAWDTNRYLNIYSNAVPCCYGYVSDFPANGVAGDTNDRIVVWWEAVGRDPTSGWPLNMGRTGTHEVGHYLGIYHTFCGGCGSAANCDTTADLICDTNGESQATLGCPGSKNSCGNSDPIHNYMDYTDDPCLWEFTPEQVNRMRCTLEDWRPDVFGTCDFALDLNQNEVSAGDTLDLTSRGGTTGQLNLLVAVNINGSPTFVKIDLGAYDSQGERPFSGTVPPGITGVVATFQSLGFYTPGTLGFSNQQVVSFN